jgi:hypothetical protein
MSELTHKKMALAFSLLSFGVMAVGSWLSGAGVITALVRATEAALLFGLLAWVLGLSLVEKDEDLLVDLHQPHEDGKGGNTDQKV